MTFALDKLYKLAVSVYELERNSPLPINVIAIAAQGSLKETAHSKILQQLLKYDDIRKSFIRDIAKVPAEWDFSKDDVRPAEEGRIDITLKNKQWCLIIENKVNNAQEQESQIFRYIERMRNEYPKSDQIRVLYLNSYSHLGPSDYSLTNNGESDEFHIKVIDTMVVKDFKSDIYKWLNTLLNTLEFDAKRANLKSAIYQYIDYLKIKFNKMDEEIEKYIIDKIFEGDTSANIKSVEERLSKIEKAISDTNSLYENLRKVRTSLLEEQYEHIVNEIKDEIKKIEGGDGKDILEKLNTYDDCYGIKLKKEANTCYIAIGYNGQPYIGIFSNGTDISSKTNCVKPILDNNGGGQIYGTKNWPIFKYIEFNDLKNLFLKLFKELRATRLV